MTQTGAQHLKGKQICQLFHDAIPSTPERRIGVEVERIALWEDGTPFQYSDKERKGAGSLLSALANHYKTQVVTYGTPYALGLQLPDGKVSLEPGSQLEFSSGIFPTLATAETAICNFEKSVSDITSPWGLNWIPLGLTPYATVSEVELIPLPRYQIMDAYLPTRGKLGTTMMRLTSSVQVNLDYASEQEAIEMLRVALAVAPLSYAIFANSPLLQGKPSGFLSYRNEIWRHTDPDRCGLLPEAFESGFDFARYADLIWRRPLMFAQDGKGNYLQTKGASLDDIAQGKLPGALIDENNCLNAIREFFPEARLKPGYIEVRSIDGQGPHMRFAAAAFWMGLLYSADARKFVLEEFGNINPKQREELSMNAAKQGLGCLHGLTELSTLLENLLPIVQTCLSERGKGEEKYLEPVFQVLDRGMNPAQCLLEKLKKVGGEPRKMSSFVECSQ